MIGTVDKETRKNVKYEIRERKNMKFRKVTAIIGAAVMMMSLAACGSSNDGGSSDGGDGGSSSGGGSSTSMPAPTTAARELQTELRATEDAMANATGASVNVGVASGNTVNVQVNAASAVEANDDAAEVLTGIARSIIDASGIDESRVQSIKIRNVSASSVDEMEAKANEILNGMNIETAKKALGSNRTITVAVENEDGTVTNVSLFVQI